MFSPKEDFDFMNSETWLKYTHERYLGEDELKHRSNLGHEPLKWDEYWQRIMVTRKRGAVPVFLDSINLKFWFFPSDSIQKKLIEIERLGTQLYDKIVAHSEFKESFLADAEIEEAISSAIYEGANTTRAKAKQLLESGKRPASKDDWMLLNNFEALNWIKENRSNQLTTDSILKIHQIVTKNTLTGDDANFCGKFRNDSVVVNSALGRIVHEGIHFSKINDAIKETIQKVTSHPRYLHPLIKGILLHYLIAYIHPFFDGNGRTARTLFYFKSMKHDLKFVELLSISAHLKNSGNHYERAFEKVKKHDWDLTYFIDYCLESLLAALKIVEGKVAYLIKINLLKVPFSINENQIGLLQRLALNKYRPVSIEKYAEEINKSREVARQELKTLVELGFLREEKSGKKFVYFVESKKLKEKVSHEEVMSIL
ncbi:MAG: Fic family protein [Bacteriovoracaceae bacterium]|nr:Fic family protein [Bacteriovoracaceae bacterium]